MKKNINNLKNTWLIIIAFAIVIFYVGNAFYTYFTDYYGYASDYYEYEKICKENSSDEVCEIYKYYENPKDKFKKEEARNLYFKIVYQHLDINLIAPLIMILIVVGIHHRDFSSGNIKNYLTRQNLKEYRNKMYKTSLKSALIFPIILLFIALISCILTKFNFTITEELKTQSQYDAWNYNNFPIYLFIHCLIVYISGVLYGNIGLLFLNKSKSQIISTLLSYMSFFIIGIFLYVFVYAIILTNIFNIETSGQLFSILGYWKLYTRMDNYFFILISVIIYTTISAYIIKILYDSKEKVLKENEK